MQNELLSIGVIGISCREAPLELREKVARIFQECVVLNKIILSTCHRIEIYFSDSDLIQTRHQILSIAIQKLGPLEFPEFYSYFGSECFLHLVYVTAGLDSAILAESEIQRQVKVAYEQARMDLKLPASVHYLFQKSLKLAKTARSVFPIFQTSTHLEGVIYRLIKNWSQKDCRILWIGYSEMNKKILHYFWKKNYPQMTLATKFIKAAENFALNYGISLKGYEEVERWDHYDVIITATAAFQFLISSRAHFQKRHFLLDLSVPRVIDPCLKFHPLISLLNMEEIGKIFEEKHKKCLTEVDAVKVFLQNKVEQHLHFYQKKTLVTLEEKAIPSCC